MTAAELASFRTLLQAQATPPPRPDRGLFSRMRARLTVVERTEAPVEARPPSRTQPGSQWGPQPGPRLATSLSWRELNVPVADPPPSVPPVFGRRETGPEVEVAPPAPAAPRPELLAVRLRRAFDLEEAHETPDELALQPPPAATGAPSPGRIAGWSRDRPASAQRRILQRLEAVFTAELQGLDARIAADAPAP